MMHYLWGMRSSMRTAARNGSFMHLLSCAHAVQCTCTLHLLQPCRNDLTAKEAWVYGFSAVLCIWYYAFQQKKPFVWKKLLSKQNARRKKNCSAKKKKNEPN